MAEKPVFIYDNDFTVTLSTLGNLTAIFGNNKIDGASNGFKVIYSEITAQFTGKTAAEGPVLWGLAANLSVAQLATILAEDPAGSRTAPIDRSPSSWLKVLGMMTLAGTAGALTGSASGDNQTARPMRVKVNWSVPEGDQFEVFAYNIGSALSGGTLIRGYIEHYGVWLRD